MNNIKSLSIYDNWYKLFKWLPKDEKAKVSLALFEYIFEDKEPTNLNEQGLDTWDNLKRLVDKSKSQCLKANKRWKNDTEEYTKDDTKAYAKHNAENDAQRYANIISLLVINNSFIKDRGLLRGKIEEWVKYKLERNEKYKETGFKSLLTQIENNVKKYGEQSVIEIINDSMANNYKGIIFEKLKKLPFERKTPNWIGKEIKEEYLTDEEVGLLDKLLNGEISHDEYEKMKEEMKQR